MAHDPTRAWPLGIGPDQTAIPGAAWLELLDGQAFPVVGAGVMVRDGNVWTPASSSNPLHTRDAALASLIGALNAAKETNPDAASASMLALLRGMLATFGKETTLAAVKAAAESLAQEDFATETTLAALLSAVGNLATEATLSGVKSAVDTLAGTVADGAQKVTLSGRKVDILVNRTDDNAGLQWTNNIIALSTIGWRNYAAAGNSPIEIGEHKNLTISIFNE